MMFPKNKPWHSEKHRRAVATLACIKCGAVDVQVCHANATKGMGTKVSDALTWPMCPKHHREHDTGGMPKMERWKLEWEYCDLARALMIQRNLWSPEAEAAYKIAIQPLARVVHADREAA